MGFTFDSLSGEITDGDGQLVATVSLKQMKHGPALAAAREMEEVLKLSFRVLRPYVGTDHAPDAEMQQAFIRIGSALVSAGVDLNEIK